MAALVGVIATVALVLRLLGAQESLFGDELYSYFVATRDGISGAFDQIKLTEANPPFFYLLAWLSAKLGDPTVLIRLPSVLSGAGTAIVVYLLGARVGRPRTGLIAAALFAVLPFAVFYGSEARAYGLLILLLPASTLALLRALDDRRALAWVLYGLVASLAIYTHYLAGLVIAIQGLWVLYTEPWRWRAIAAVNAAVLVAFVPWIGMIGNRDQTEAIKLLHPLTAENAATDSLRVVFGHPFAGAEQVPGLISVLIVVVAIGIAVAGLIVARPWRRPPGPPGRLGPGGAPLDPVRDEVQLSEIRLLALIVVGAPLLTLIYSLLDTTIYLPRNVITVLPYLCVLVALAIAALPRRASLAVAALTVLAALFGSVRMLADYPRPDLHAAAEMVESRSAPGTPVIELPFFPLPQLREDLAIYLDDRYGLSHDLNDLTRAPSGADAWVILPNTDLRGQLDAAADAAGAELLEAHTIEGLADVYVAKYRLSSTPATPTGPSDGETQSLTARDIAKSAGIARIVHTQGENCVFDYNGDGIEDLFLSTHDDAPWQLFRGTPRGKFVETNVGTFPYRDRHGCATGDFNRDGRPDIYASIGGCEGTCRAAKELWIQKPDGTFADRAAQFGIAGPGGRGRQPITLDANGDRWPDLYTGQAVGIDYPSPNRLWLNDAGTRFVNPPGLPTEAIGSLCAAAGDVDSDGYDELVACGEHTFRIYDNTRGRWSDATKAMGLPSWGRRDAELADLNGDGKLDLVTVADSIQVRLNESGRFPETSYERPLADGRDLAIGDADGDGDQDIYVLQGSNATVPDLLLLNSGSGKSYVSFSGLPQVTTGVGDKVEAIPGWKGTSRAAFLVNNGFESAAGPRQLIELVGG